MALFDFLRKSNNRKDTGYQALLEMTEVEPGMMVPKAFALHWDKIAPTRRQCITIGATPGIDLEIRQSSFGHYPCIPTGFEYPKDSDGNYMFPLAQIIFSEMPPMPGYPTSGVLQFYIACSESASAYGMNFDNCQDQSNFRVHFFEEHEVKEILDESAFPKNLLNNDYAPVSKPRKLTFSPKTEYWGLEDFTYEINKFKVDELVMLYPQIEKEINEFAWDKFESEGHKIGGYAYFTQSDPRTDKPEFKDYILLLQIDTDEEIMWGDSGVGNFFIHPDDLAKRDFSRVMYNWDCC